MPLYLSQALAVAMYVFGFREGWNWQFPGHAPLLVDLVVFVVILTLALVSANLSFRVQYVFMGVIGLSLISILGSQEVWQSGQTTAEYLDATNQNLGILCAIRLVRAWKADLNLLSVVPDEDSLVRARGQLEEVRDLCRIPDHAVATIVVGEFADAVARAPLSDLETMGFSSRRDLASMAQLVQLTRSSCLFVCDSGEESALS